MSSFIVGTIIFAFGIVFLVKSRGYSKFLPAGKYDHVADSGRIYRVRYADRHQLTCRGGMFVMLGIAFIPIGCMISFLGPVAASFVSPSQQSTAARWTVVPSASKGSVPTPLSIQSSNMSILKRVRSEHLNMRFGAGIQFSIVKQLDKGNEVVSLGEQQVIEGTTWIRIRVGIQEGWINQAFVE